MRAFAEYINRTLQNDPQLLGLLPLGTLSWTVQWLTSSLDPQNHDQFFAALHDGVLLCKLLNIDCQDKPNINPAHIAINPKVHTPSPT